MLPEDTFIHFHTHETAGIGVSANMAALDAGADAIDLSMAPCSGGTCQPDIIVMWHALRGSDYDLDIDIDKIRDAEEVFKECMADYFLPPEAVAVEPMIPWSPMPGGALTANTQMLRDNGIMDKYPDMIKAMRKVVEKGGFGTSVTPVSQFYFQQAFNNVMFGPWERIAAPYGQMVLGYFGKTPVRTRPFGRRDRRSTARAGANDPKAARTQRRRPEQRRRTSPANNCEKLALEETDENIFIVAACQDKGLAFLKGEGEIGVRKVEKEQKEAAPTDGPAHYAITVDGRRYAVAIDGDTATVDGRRFQVSLEQEQSTDAATPSSPAPKADGGTPVQAQMPGKVIRHLVQPGDHVEAGDGIIVLEAMKMEMPVTAPVGGTVADILVHAGDQVADGQVLARIG